MRNESIKIFITIIALITLSGCVEKKIKRKYKNTNIENKKNKKNKESKKINKTAEKINDLSSFSLDNSLNKTNSKIKNNIDNDSQAAEISKNKFKNLYFDFDKSNLNADQKNNLLFDINYAKEMIKDGKKIVIEGHSCNSAGSRSYNLALSEKRAKAVAKEFEAAGIENKFIKIAPRGIEELLCDGNKEEQKINRRAVIFAI